MTLGRGKRDAYLDLLEREHGVVGRLLGYGVIDKRVPPLWESRALDFPLASFVLEHATGLVVHSRYVRDRARAAGFDGPVAVVPHPAWPVPDVAAERRRARGRPRLLRRREREQADPRAPARDGGASADARRGDAAPRRPDLARIRPRPQAATARAGRRRRRAGAVGRREASVGAHGGQRRRREPAAPDDGRDVRQRRPRALARQAAGRERRRLVRGASGRRRPQGPSGRRRGRDADRRARAPRHATGRAGRDERERSRPRAARARRRPRRRAVRRGARAHGGRRLRSTTPSSTR